MTEALGYDSWRSSQQNKKRFDSNGSSHKTPASHIRYTRRPPCEEIMGILELLHRRGVPQTAEVKIVRHKDKRYDLETLIAKGHFEAGYQAYQARHVFDCDYMVSCIGLPDFRARLFGVYRVAGHRPAKDIPLPPHLLYLKDVDPIGWAWPGLVWYDLVKVKGFEDLENRVIIDWGPGARSWIQWAKPKRDKRIIEMPFRG